MTSLLDVFFFSNPHRHCSWRGCEKKGKKLKRKRPEIEVTYQDQEVVILQDLVDLKDSVRVATDPMECIWA